MKKYINKNIIIISIILIIIIGVISIYFLKNTSLSTADIDKCINLLQDTKMKNNVYLFCYRSKGQLKLSDDITNLQNEQPLILLLNTPVLFNVENFKGLPGGALENIQFKWDKSISSVCASTPAIFKNDKSSFFSTSNEINTNYAYNPETKMIDFCALYNDAIEKNPIILKGVFNNDIFNNVTDKNIKIYIDYGTPIRNLNIDYFIQNRHDFVLIYNKQLF